MPWSSNDGAAEHHRAASKEFFDEIASTDSAVSAGEGTRYAEQPTISWKSEYPDLKSMPTTAALSNGYDAEEDEEKTLRDFLFDEEEYLIRKAFELRTPGGYKVNVFGGHDLVLKGPIDYYDFESLMLDLEVDYDLIVVKQGEKTFQVYCNDAQSRDVVYVYKCRQSRAADLMSLLTIGIPVGLPQANALQGQGEITFDQHTVPELRPFPPLPLRLQPARNPEGPQLPIRPPPEDVSFDLSLDNGIMVSGQLADVRQAVRKLRVLDRPTRVVLIEVLIVQYFHDEQFTWRYNLSDGAVLKGDPPQFSSGTTQPGTIVPEADTFGPQPWGIDFQNVAWNPATGAASLAYSGIGSLTSQFKQNLTFLASEDMARVVTNPHVAVINGKTGQILLNEKFNFVNSVVTPTGTITEKADSLDALTSINVTPTILGPDRVHVAVNTSLATFDVVSDAFSPLPGQRINELGTSVVLSEGKSLILGGLVKEEMGESREKIPGFAKIPLLGHFFRGKRETRRFSETVVYITPRLFEPEGYEDEYRQQVFEETDDLKHLGEQIRERNRWDKTESHRLYRQKELLDHAAHKQLHHDVKQMKKDFHGQWHCPIHNGNCDCMPPESESTFDSNSEDDPANETADDNE